MTYDIRTPETAAKTFCDITRFPISTLPLYQPCPKKWIASEELLPHIIANNNGSLPNDYTDWNFIFSHVTTSANNCASIREHGLLDLPNSYLCKDSELRTFLDEHKICIDLNTYRMSYDGRTYSIAYHPESCSERSDPVYKFQSIGEKFCHDFAICGFLSIRKGDPYKGNVHHAPEILSTIDDALNTHLAEKWHQSHTPYAITVKVKGDKIVVHNSEVSDTIADKTFGLVHLAFLNALEMVENRIILTKNCIQIPPSDILEITPFDAWESTSLRYKHLLPRE